MRVTRHVLRMALFSLLVALLASVTIPLAAHAQEESSQKVVRVGWYETPFNITDEFGRRSGYAYEYQQKVAAYTGWTYEYVEGSWPELMQKLIDGEIDLMSDVSYTDERSDLMLFSSLPMGSEDYFVYATPGNQEVSKDDYSTISGKTVGVNKGSIQAKLFLDWASKNNVKARLVELTTSEDESLAMLDRGDIDLYVTLDFYAGDISRSVPICKIGSSDFYFAVNKSRPDLLKELDDAMGKMQDTNRYYNQQMYLKYFKSSGVNLYLDAAEGDWLATHGAIRVGYQDNHLAFCAKDTKTGELTGALRDYLGVAEDCLANAHLDFEPVAYPTAEAAMEALADGEVDCMFPANLSAYDAENRDVFMTSPLIRTGVSAVIRMSDQQAFAQKESIVVAVNQGNPNYDLFLVDHFPQWQAVHYPNTEECLRAVADKEADCYLISNYRFNSIATLCKKLKLLSMSTGEEMDYCFAVDRDNKALCSILNKSISVVPTSKVNAAMSYYFAEDATTSIADFIRNNLGIVVAVVATILLVFLLLILRSVKAEKKADAGRQLILATESDQLTGLYNRSYFYEYAHRMYRLHPERPMDAIVLNIERFHSINAMNGRAFGDQVLRSMGDEIREFLNETEGIAGRSVGDRFAIYCLHFDDYQALFDLLQGKLDELSPTASLLLRMGVMPWEAGVEPAQQFEHALVACNMARGHYNDHLIVFDEQARKREAFEQRLLNDMRHAVENREFIVYYQPKYDIQVEPPKLKSAEALIRWQHPELGMIAPNDFIPLFEQNGLIGLVDNYVWAEAARQVARWRDAYGIVVPVSVNLSRVDVFDPMLEDTLDSLIEKNGLDRSALKLEVTESAYTENADQVISVIEGLRKKGYEIEMDDFGSGYSSLNMLSSMPVDVLKMDRAFILNIEHDDKDVRLVELVLDIAKNLKVPVIAEGVETKTQLLMLKELGCALVQGYYFSRPLPADEFERKLLA